MTYITAQPCVDTLDRAYVEECPVDYVYEGKRMLYVHPDECVDCGACEPVCSAETIFYENDVPDEWVEFIDANIDQFNEPGSSGGTAELGPQDFDVPSVAALPPQAED